jgi:hypothetical protein
MGSDENGGFELIVVCLVTDKKYRKMGGSEGLNGSLLKLNLSAPCRVFQVPVREIIKNGHVSSEAFYSSLGKFCNSKTVKVKIVHKYSDFYKSSKLTSLEVSELRSWLMGFEGDSRVTLLDPPAAIDVLSNRNLTGLLVQELCHSEGFSAAGLQWPEFFSLSGGFEDFKFPVIVKPVDACSTDDSHWMSLYIKGPTNHIKGKSTSSAVLVQKYYEHYGILYKVYVIGHSVEIVARPSISTRAFPPELSVHRFNTHKFKQTEGDLSPERLAEADRRIDPLRSLIESFALRLKARLGLTWFGVDVIIPEDSECLKAAVIDVNYMPGYDGIACLSDKLINAILNS